MLKKFSELSREEICKVVRRWIVYGLIALVIVLSVVAVVNLARGFFLTMKINDLKTELSQMEEANKSLADSVANIRQLRELDSKILSQLSTRLSNELKRDSQLRTQIEILEATNESARDYLDTPIHPDVVRLLSEDQDGTGSARAPGQPSGPVRGGDGASLDRESGPDLEPK